MTKLSDAPDFGYVQLMEPLKQQRIKGMMPYIADFRIQAAIQSSRTMWYDEHAIVPGYQDSMGDPEGMRPNTIEKILIDLAVPGGHARVFARSGRFNFPFGTGGADRSSNLVKVNFWTPPSDGGKALPVVYWRLPFSRWRWMFPVGTLIGEVLMIRYPSGDERVFEVRVRERMHSGWANKVFRPYNTAGEFGDAIKNLRPGWRGSNALRTVVEHLSDPRTLTDRTLTNTQYRGAVDDIDGSVDVVPDLGDEILAKELLTNRVFGLANGTVWKESATRVAYASSTDGQGGIVPDNYDGGLLEISDASCKRCHDQAGRQIGDFHSDLIAYGELWGEDETFSWHPFDNARFVRPDGTVNNFNNDNRRLRQDFIDAGLVEPYQASSHPRRFYQELPRDWTYRPI